MMTGHNIHCGPDASAEICIQIPITTTTSSTTTHATMQSTTPNMTLPPFEHIGSNGCPDDFFLDNNNGSLIFDCQYAYYSCGAACNSNGYCSSQTCTSGDEACADALNSGTIYMQACISYVLVHAGQVLPVQVLWIKD